MTAPAPTLTTTQAFVLLAAHNIRMVEGRDERVRPRDYRTKIALRELGCLDEIDRPNVAGLKAAGVDMEALHDAAEARTGVSDRTAAALDAVAELRRMVVASVVSDHDNRSRMRELLAGIGQALRAQSGAERRCGVRRRGLVGALAALVLLTPTLGGCKQESGSGQHSPRQRADQGHAQPPPVPPAANQPGPQADPGQCDDRGVREVSMHATWDSETRATPEVYYTKNGVKVPAANLASHRNSAGKVAWGGEWSAIVGVKCHDVLALDLKGTPSQVSCLVTIVDLGNGPVGSGRPDHTCHVDYVVP